MRSGNDGYPIKARFNKYLIAGGNSNMAIPTSFKAELIEVFGVKY
jgi:hypothetical protein